MGPLGELLRTHDSLGSMTNAPGTTPQQRSNGTPPYCHGIRVARRSENASSAQERTRHKPRHAGASAFPTVPYGRFYVRPMANSHPPQGQVIETFQGNDGFLDLTLAAPARPRGRNQIPTLFQQPSRIRACGLTRVRWRHASKLRNAVVHAKRFDWKNRAWMHGCSV